LRKHPILTQLLEILLSKEHATRRTCLSATTREPWIKALVSWASSAAPPSSSSSSAASS
jgi:hypothetical protein